VKKKSKSKSEKKVKVTDLSAENANAKGGTGGELVGMGDGSVRTFSTTTPTTELKANKN
jgi:hypothetical protein